MEEQKQCRRRSACIVDGGKEKEVEEMREALKVGLPRVDGRPNSRAGIVCVRQLLYIYAFIWLCMCVKSVLHVSVTVTVSRSYCVPLCACVRVCMYE